MNKVFIGVDPGQNGGLVALDGKVVAFHKMPETRRGVYDWLAKFSPVSLDDPKPIAVVEKVSGYIGQGHPGSRMFTFGANAERVLMALTILGIAVDEVPPQEWMRGLGIKSRHRSESKTEWKGRLKLTAQVLFPNLKVTLATADALLLAHWGRKKHGGQ